MDSESHDQVNPSSSSTSATHTSKPRSNTKPATAMAKSKAIQSPITIPEAERGSLRHLIVSNSSKKLYLHPELWTPEVLRFLDCTCVAAHDSGDMFPSIELASFSGHHWYNVAFGHYFQASSAFNEGIHDQDKKIRHMLSSFLFIQAEHMEKLEWDLSGLSFFFNQRVVAKLDGPLFTLDSIPGCAFIDEGFMMQYQERFPRRDRIRAKWGYSMIWGGKNDPSKIDPYFVAFMIAMAQDMQYLTAPKGTDGASRSVYLFTTPEDRRSLTLYTAEVTFQFLQKFNCPYQNSPAHLTITSHQLPINPPTKLLGAVKNIIDSARQYSASVTVSENNNPDH